MTYDPDGMDPLVTASDSLRVTYLGGAGLKNMCFWKVYFETQ